MNNIDISFVTINYNSSFHTIKLIKSIIDKSSFNYEIIIVDNASTVEDFNKLKQFITSIKNTKIKLIRNNINTGFASGNMLGAKYSVGEYFFFINNDTELKNDCSLIMKKYLDSNHEVSLATGKIFDSEGKVSSPYKLFPTPIKQLFGNTIARKVSKEKYPSNKAILSKPTYVEVISGACMFFRSSTFKKIDGFDTNFFLYCEEEDISKRVLNVNKKIVFLPDSEIFHFHGASTKKNFNSLKEFYISYKYLLFKHYNFLIASFLIFLQLIKLLRRIFRHKDGLNLFLFGLKGFKSKDSLKYNQKKISSSIEIFEFNYK